MSPFIGFSSHSASAAATALFTLAMAAVAAYVGDEQRLTLSASFLAIVLGVISYHDVLRFRIPNAVTYPALAGILALNGIASLAHSACDAAPERWFGVIGLAESCGGALLGFAMMAFVFSLTGRGAGDVKLAATIGAFVGPGDVLKVVILAHLLAGVFAASWLVWRIGPYRGVKLLLKWLGSKAAPQIVRAPVWPDRRLFQRPIPLAGFFSLAAILTIGGF